MDGLNEFRCKLINSKSPKIIKKPSKAICKILILPYE
jgi:hypothetical protein